MNLSELLLKLQFAVNKTQSGRRLTPEYYNVLLSDASNKKFADEWKALELGAKNAGGRVYESMIVNTPLRRFKKDADLDSPSISGSASLPADFHYPFGLTALYMGSIRKIDPIGEEELNEYRASLSMPTLEYNPKAVFYGTYLKVLPTNVGAGSDRINLVYLRHPATPYYDYCFRLNAAIPIYMPPGSYISMDGAVPTLYNSQGGVLAINVSHPGFSTGAPIDNGTPLFPPYYSLSIELDWDEPYHPAISGIILEMMGVNLNPGQVNELANKIQQ